MHMGLASLRGRLTMLALLVALVVAGGCACGLILVGGDILDGAQVERAIAMSDSIDRQVHNLSRRGSSELARFLHHPEGLEDHPLFTHLVIGRDGQVEEHHLRFALDDRHLAGFLLGEAWDGSCFALLGDEPCLVFGQSLPEEAGRRQRQALAVLQLQRPLQDLLECADWRLQIHGDPLASSDFDLQRGNLPRAQLRMSDDGSSFQLRYAGRGGSIIFQLRAPDDSGLRQQLLETVIVTGMIAALVAVLLAMALGSQWLAPINRLARSLSQQRTDAPETIVEESSIEEVAQVARAFNQLLHRLDRGREELRHSLNDQEQAASLQRRFVRRILSELYQPLQVLITTFDDVQRDPDLIRSERFERSRQAARDLAERLALLRGMDSDAPEQSGVATYRMRLDVFCGQLCDMMADLARNAACQLLWEAPDRSLAFDNNLVTQILVSLLANALRAPGVTTVRLRAAPEHEQVLFRVCDDGRGFDADLADRLHAACVRGSVLPEEPGFGLGLPLAFAQAQGIGAQIRFEANAPEETIIALLVPCRNLD